MWEIWIVLEVRRRLPGRWLGSNIRPVPAAVVVANPFILIIMRNEKWIQTVWVGSVVCSLLLLGELRGAARWVSLLGSCKVEFEYYRCIFEVQRGE